MTERQKEKVIERLQSLIDEEVFDATIISQIVEDSEDFVLSYTNRTVLPDVLLRTVGDLSIIAFNRLGTEGESGRSEAGESYSFEAAPHHVFSLLNRYRIARCGGSAHEKKSN